MTNKTIAASRITLARVETRATSFSKPVTLLLFIALPLVASCGNSTKSASERFCKEFQPHAREINRQAPISIDFLTSLTGVSAIYSAAVCTITYQKLVNEELFISAVLEEARRSGQYPIFDTPEKIISFFNSSEGRDYLSQIFNHMLTEDARYRGIERVEQYHQITFDRGNIRSSRILVTK